MRTDIKKRYNIILCTISMVLFSISCTFPVGKKSFVFKDYPDLKLGFSTQNFQMALPTNLENLNELIKYASQEGYQFIELRDDLARLTNQECSLLSETARNNKIDVIYELQINPLDTGFFKVFQKGLSNAVLFPGPGIIRTLVSKSEFDANPDKKGWTSQEVALLARIADSCSNIAAKNNIKLVVENLNEPFFGDQVTYLGLTDFFTSSKSTGLQFDLSNPFRKSSRSQADPDRVLEFLSTLGDRWIVTHLKTNVDGDPQSILTDNPLSIEEIIEAAGRKNAKYVAIEIVPVSDITKCYDNHIKSIQFLKDRGILKK